MAKRVALFTQYWYKGDLRSNPSWLFVFGDNDVQRGKYGQSIIRDEPNALGIPTKKIPISSRNMVAYYSDKELKENEEKINTAVVTIIKEFMDDKYDVLVLPKNGLGTGLAKLPIKAPKTYAFLDKKIKALAALFN